jgi:hypothetical protein
MASSQRKRRREKEFKKAGLEARNTEHQLQQALDKVSALELKLQEADAAKGELLQELSNWEGKWYRREREHEDRVKILCRKALTDIHELDEAHTKSVSALVDKVSALEAELREQGIRALRRRLKEKSEALSLANRKCKGYEKRIRKMLDGGF